MTTKLKILFVVDRLGYTEVSSIPLLSAVAKKRGHSVKLVEYGKNPAAVRREVAGFSPDITCYSVSSYEARRYLEINARLRQDVSFFSVFGGPHPTFFPEFIREDGVDAICRGEGDIVFRRFLDTFGTAEMYNTPNFSFIREGGGIAENSMRELVADLDEVPFPDREIVYAKSSFLRRNPVRVFFAGRGCPFNCSYCFNHAYNALYKGKGAIVREKTVDRLLEEIKHTSAQFPISFIKFHDDVFGIQKDWLKEFAERYPREVGLPFLCYARPNMINEEYCADLEKAGVFSVSIAIESGNEGLRRQVLNRKMTNEQIIGACRMLKDHGIRIYTLNMIGLPGETEKEMCETVDINRSVRPDFADCSIFQPYPGTAISEYCRKHGYIDEDADGFESQYSESVLNFTERFKRRLFVYQRMFPILVDHPSAERWVDSLCRAKFLSPALDMLYRYYYGSRLHKRVYANVIPLSVRLLGAASLMLSKNRV